MDKKPTHWADQWAERIINQIGDKEYYTVASGITPSGTIHIGNFREIITVDLIARALKDAGKKVRFIYSWDDYDVFRKVPKNFPKQAILKKALRKPVCDVPDVFEDGHSSFAEHNEKAIEDILPKVGIHPEFLYQYIKYRDEKAYSEGIKKALSNIEKIKQTLNKYRKEPLADDWLPVTVFCDECGRDTTKVSYFGKYELSYDCDCGKKETFDFRKKGNASLRWRVDWPMRWDYEEVDFEPAGKDHYAAGGSRTTGEIILKELWKKTIMGFMYEWISIKGGKQFSSSAGEIITLHELLEVYEPEILRWLFAGSRPTAVFEISFDTDVLKLYEDFDKCERVYFGEHKLTNEKEIINQKRIYELSVVETVPKKMPFQPSFRHLTSILQINHLDIDKTISFYEKQLKNSYDKQKLRIRASCAKNWLEKHAPDDFKFQLQDFVPKDLKISKAQSKALKDLAAVLKQRTWTPEELHEEFYIIKENQGLSTQEFFQAAYKVLINKEKGPKLASFLLEIGEKAVQLLEQA